MFSDQNIVSATISKSVEKIRQLSPPTRVKAGDFVADVLGSLGVPLLVYSSYRSIPEQLELYRKYQEGGPRAAPPGRSFHNYGRAFDAVPIAKDGSANWDSPLWPDIVAIASRNGLSSGQKYGDVNHFEDLEGPSIDALAKASPLPSDVVGQVAVINQDAKMRRKKKTWIIGLGGLVVIGGIIYIMGRDE